jgi:hypothetical protein
MTPDAKNKIFLGARVSAENAKWLAMRTIDESYHNRRRVSKSEMLDRCLTFCRLNMPAPTEQE